MSKAAGAIGREIARGEGIATGYILIFYSQFLGAKARRAIKPPSRRLKVDSANRPLCPGSTKIPTLLSIVGALEKARRSNRHEDGAALPIQKLDEGAFASSSLLKGLGRRLEQYRAERKWSVLRLAKTCGVSHAFVTHIMEGRANPSILVVQKMATNLDVHEGWLLGLLDDPTPQPVTED
jgi:DNA-binding XRE family transcriptional regulator